VCVKNTADRLPQSEIALLGRILDDAIASDDGTFRQSRELCARFAQDVHDIAAGGKQIVRDDAAVTPPPHGLGAHDGRLMRAAVRQQVCERGAEERRARVVGIVVKTLMRPKAIDAARHGRIAAAATAQRRCVRV
jgi:hypothetical protein